MIYEQKWRLGFQNMYLFALEIQSKLLTGSHGCSKCNGFFWVLKMLQISVEGSSKFSMLTCMCQKLADTGP